jgi:hypothetical protein
VKVYLYFFHLTTIYFPYLQNFLFAIINQDRGDGEKRRGREERRGGEEERRGEERRGEERRGEERRGEERRGEERRRTYLPCTGINLSLNWVNKFPAT